jgi:EpsI family protein
MSVAARTGRISRRGVLFGGLLGAVGVSAHFSREALNLLPAEAPALDHLVPRRIGPWRFAGTGGLVLPSDKLEKEAYDQELKRIYLSDSGRMIMLVIAYSARPRQGLLALHDPQVCYSGGGFALTNLREGAVQLTASSSVPVQSFTARSPWRVEEVVYWTKIGDEIRSPSDRQHLVILDSMFRGALPDGVLVRVSTLGSGADEMRDVRRFVQELYGALPQQGRKLLLGRLGANAEGRRAAAQAL